MPPSAAPRLRTAASAGLATVALLVAALTTPAALAAPAASAAAAEPASTGLAAQVAALNADITRVSDELARGAMAYEAAQADLARLTQDAFAARADVESRTAESTRTRSSLDGLARAAYKGGLPPIVTALLSGDPRSVGDLAYVQRSVNAVGLDRREAVRAAYLQQVRAGKVVTASASARRRALAARQDLDRQLQELSVTADRLTAELAATAARLAQVKAEEQARALAARQATALREAARQARLLEQQRAAELARLQAAALPIPSTLLAPTISTGGPSCQPPSAYGEANGFLSDAGLCPLSVGGGHRLRTDAAQAFDRLNAAHLASVGRPICVTDSYRSYPEQVDVFKRKPELAATPGRSQHGWGLALDLCGGVQTFDSPDHLWMAAYGAQFGWVHPPWAQRGGSKPEPWHWEYVGVPAR